MIKAGDILQIFEDIYPARPTDCKVNDPRPECHWPWGWWGAGGSVINREIGHPHGKPSHSGMHPGGHHPGSTPPGGHPGGGGPAGHGGGAK